MSPEVWRLDGVLLDLLTSLGAPFERVEAGAYVVSLVGRRRRSTLVWLIAGEQAVAVEAFVLHVIGEPAGPLHRHLLARNLRRLRRERGMTQETLSHESGVMQSHLSEIEAGKRNASVDLIGVIAAALDVPVAALFTD